MDYKKAKYNLKVANLAAHMAFYEAKRSLLIQKVNNGVLDPVVFVRGMNSLSRLEAKIQMKSSGFLA